MNADMFICSYCENKFQYKSYLKKHIISKHVKECKWLCYICDKSFVWRSSLCRHELTHTNIKFECFHCSKIFDRKMRLAKHLHKTHNFIDEASQVSKFRCSQCSYSCSNKATINHHYRSQHNINLEIQQLFFPSYADFEAWKLQMQKRTVSQFLKRNIWKTSAHTVRIFQCHRSGLRLLKENSKKLPRQNGSKKLNFHCPAEIRVKIKAADGSCAVQYVTTHVGHILGDENELRHVYLNETECIEIAANLKLGVSRQVLREKKLLNKFGKESDNRPFDLNQYDTNNAAKNCSVAKEYKFGSGNDMAVVDSFVEKSKNIILYYKKEMEKDDKFILPDPSSNHICSVDLQPCSNTSANGPFLSPNADTNTQSSSHQQLVEETRKMHRIVDTLLSRALEIGGTAEHLKWIRKQHLEPAIPSLDSCILTGKKR